MAEAPVGNAERDYRAWRGDPDAWWRQAAEAIDWEHRSPVLRDETPPHGRWFPQGTLNMSANCLDRHVEGGRGAQAAMIWESPAAGETRTYSYAALRDLVARFAGVLRDAGVAKGQTVLIYMPMVPEAVVAMLACARLGAIHSVVFGGFAPPELAARIDDAHPSVIVTASCGIERERVVPYLPLVDEALALSGHSPHRRIVLQRPQHMVQLAPDDIDFEKAVATATPAEPIMVVATDPLYILYTSGTTGRPKGVVRDTGGYAVALAWSMATIYGLRPGDVMWAASDIGWVVGHSYIVYAPLLTGCTTILYEGKPVGTPDAAAFWRICERHGVNILFTAPTAIRAIRKDDPRGSGIASHDLGRLAAVFLAGERCDPATVEWLSGQLQRPIIDHWWQTETGWPITAFRRDDEWQDRPAGSGGRAMPGWRLQVFDDDGAPVAPGTPGRLMIERPLPPGAAVTVWNDDARFTRSYLEEMAGWFATGDGGVIDEAGNVFVTGRIDDVMNVAGHRLSTGSIEEAAAGHPDVVECAVIGAPDTLKGEVPVALVVLSDTARERAAAVTGEVVDLVRRRVGPIATPGRVVPVEMLPKTRSGKILRKVLRQIARGERPEVPATIDNPDAVGSVAAALARG